MRAFDRCLGRQAPVQDLTEKAGPIGSMGGDGFLYYCEVCGEGFNENPHTVPCTGEDCHEACCPVCHGSNLTTHNIN